jgi:integrase
MARVKRDSTIENRSARAGLKARREPYWLVLVPGRSLGYRKGSKAGVWVAKLYDPTLTPSRRYGALGAADDHFDPNGTEILSFAQAQTKAGEWFTQILQEVNGEAPHTGPFTVEDALEGYLEYREGQGMKSAADSRRRSRMHIYPQLGALEVGKLTRLRLERWRDALGNSPAKIKGGLGRAPRERPAPATADEKRARKASANRVLATLKAALTWAKDRGLVHCPDDAWRGVKPFRGVEEARQAYLTPDQQTRLVNSIKEADFKRLVTGALTTGCRYGELTRMKVSDFDPNPGGVASVLIREGKDGKFRRALLTTEGREFFEGITAGRPADEAIFVKDADQRLMAVKRGEFQTLPWSTSDQTRRMEEACEAAKLPRMGFHQLRHSYASALVTAGMPLAMVAKLTGHADTRMLERHYAHLAPSDLSRALEALAPKLGLGTPKVATLKLKKKA